MRRLERNRAHAEEEESVFVTMTDMTISFLLIIMILLAFFATQINEDDTVSLSVYETVRTERDALRIENRDLDAEVERLSDALAATTTERDQLQTERDQLRADNEVLGTRIAELERNVEGLEEEIARLRAQLDEVISERDQLRTERDQLSTDNEVLGTRIAELEQNVEGLEEEIARLRAQLDEVIAERDWLREQLERFREVNPLEAYLSQVMEQRREILVELRDRLLVEFPEIQVMISPEQDALRFQGEGLFSSGQWGFARGSRGLRIVKAMGRQLDEILVCFTLGERAERGPDCESGNALIEAVQIEGHTDSDPGTRIDNVTLSTRRANATFFAIRDTIPGILAHRNLRGQPVMSVAGYGAMRPVDPRDKAANRRIDLRIIMYAPSTVEEVAELGRRLDALRALGGEE